MTEPTPNIADFVTMPIQDRVYWWSIIHQNPTNYSPEVLAAVSERLPGGGGEPTWVDELHLFGPNKKAQIEYVCEFFSQHKGERFMLGSVLQMLIEKGHPSGPVRSLNDRLQSALCHAILYGNEVHGFIHPSWFGRFHVCFGHLFLFSSDYVRFIALNEAGWTSKTIKHPEGVNPYQEVIASLPEPPSHPDTSVAALRDYWERDPDKFQEACNILRIRIEDTSLFGEPEHDWEFGPGGFSYEDRLGEKCWLSWDAFVAIEAALAG